MSILLCLKTYVIQEYIHVTLFPYIHVHGVTHLGQHEISGAQEIIFTSIIAVPIIHNEGQHGLLDYTTSKIHVTSC